MANGNIREILDHKRTKPGEKDYHGSMYSVLLEWEDGTKSWKGHRELCDEDPIILAIYADKHGLTETRLGGDYLVFRRYLKTRQRLVRRANQAKLHSFRTKPVYMYGYQVPRNHAQAMDLDRVNCNTKWRDAEVAELGMIDEFGTFEDKGDNWKSPW